MDIGTAKPSVGEREQLPHHLIDIRDPSQQFNAGDFVRLADEACLQIAERGKLAVVSGGTGFYLKNFIMGLSEAPPSNSEIREQLKQELRIKGASALMEELTSCDPVSAGRIHINDEYRLLRALEVYRSCGHPLSSFEVSSQPRCESEKQNDYRFIIIGLSRPRDEIYRRINLRCTEMFRIGLADEVRSLYEAGYTPNDPGLRATRQLAVISGYGRSAGSCRAEQPALRQTPDYFFFRDSRYRMDRRRQQ
jgi:tRNA dimethylallyltransferase